MGLVSAVAGIFGMNLESGGEEDNTQKSYIYFILVAVISTCCCVILFVGLVLFLKSKRLMFVPEPKIVSSTIDRSQRFNRMSTRKATTSTRDVKR